MKVNSKSGAIELSFTNNINDLEFYKRMVDMYDNFQKEIFDSEITIPESIKPMIEIVYDFHKQSQPKYNLTEYNKVNNDVSNNKDVVVAYSGGLDSCYIAIHLREQGFNPHIFHVKNINTYENSQSTKAVREFVDKYDFDYIEVSMSKVGKSSPYKQFYPENPIKNQFIFALMIDYCLLNGYHLIASGDERLLEIKDAVVGTNLTDTLELQDAFISGIKEMVNIDFIDLNRIKKNEEITFMVNHNLINDYYSCITAGRFNQSFRRSNIAKYNLNEQDIPKWNCCGCRKCSEHLLLLHYLGYKKWSPAFEDHLWKSMNGKHAAKEYLWKNKTKEELINNLMND